MFWLLSQLHHSCIFLVINTSLKPLSPISLLIYISPCAFLYPSICQYRSKPYRTHAVQNHCLHNYRTENDVSPKLFSLLHIPISDPPPLAYITDNEYRIVYITHICIIKSRILLLTSSLLASNTDAGARFSYLPCYLHHRYRAQNHLTCNWSSICTSAFSMIQSVLTLCFQC